MNPILRDYIYFTRSQRKALGIILLFIGLLILFNQYAHLIFKEEVDFELSQVEVKYQELISRKSNRAVADLDEEDRDQIEKQLFSFDPNQISQVGWQKLGLSEAQANSILKYRDKGGEFRVKSDLKKMYVVSTERYSEWEPYIQLPDELPETNADKSFKRSSVRSKEAIILDLNLADSAKLTKLRGIGPVYAARIVRFRQSLGGFHSLDQLAEVWGIDDTTLSKLRPHLTLKEPQLTRLKINQLEAADLKSHPYLNWQEANAIVNYRKQHGAFKDSKDLGKIYLLSDSLIQKLSPYLEFD